MIQAFFKLEGGTRIEGESRCEGHVGEIELMAFRWEGRAEVRDADSCNRLVIRKSVDRASPALARICAAGEKFPQATLSALIIAARKPTDFYQVRLSGLRVVSVIVEAHELDQDSAASAQERLDEEVAFEFSSAETTWRPSSRDGLPDAPVIESGVLTDPGSSQPGDPAGELLRQAAAMGFDIRPPVARRW
jgi:type VI secretion system Hcp family effector